jgi:hypothetical protein
MCAHVTYTSQYNNARAASILKKEIVDTTERYHSKLEYKSRSLPAQHTISLSSLSLERGSREKETSIYLEGEKDQAAE